MAGLLAMFAEFEREILRNRPTASDRPNLSPPPPGTKEIFELDRLTQPYRKDTINKFDSIRRNLGGRGFLIP